MLQNNAIENNIYDISKLTKQLILSNSTSEIVVEDEPTKGIRTKLVMCTADGDIFDIDNGEYLERHLMDSYDWNWKIALDTIYTMWMYDYFYDTSHMEDDYKNTRIFTPEMFLRVKNENLSLHNFRDEEVQKAIDLLDRMSKVWVSISVLTSQDELSKNPKLTGKKINFQGILLPVKRVSIKNEDGSDYKTDNGNYAVFYELGMMPPVFDFIKNYHKVAMDKFIKSLPTEESKSSKERRSTSKTEIKRYLNERISGMKHYKRSTPPNKINENFFKIIYERDKVGMFSYLGYREKQTVMQDGMTYSDFKKKQQQNYKNWTRQRKTIHKNVISILDEFVAQKHIDGYIVEYEKHHSTQRPRGIIIQCEGTNIFANANISSADNEVCQTVEDIDTDIFNTEISDTQSDNLLSAVSVPREEKQMFEPKPFDLDDPNPDITGTIYELHQKEEEEIPLCIDDIEISQSKEANDVLDDPDLLEFEETPTLDPADVYDIKCKIGDPTEPITDKEMLDLIDSITPGGLC